MILKLPDWLRDLLFPLWLRGLRTELAALGRHRGASGSRALSTPHGDAPTRGARGIG